MMPWEQLGLIILLSVALFIAWAEIMYYFAGKDRGIIFGLIYGIVVGLPLFLPVVGFLTSFNFFSIIIGIFLLLFIIFVGMTLYEQAGRKLKKWYYLTLIFPLLSIVYQFVKD